MFAGNCARNACSRNLWETSGRTSYANSAWDLSSRACGEIGAGLRPKVEVHLQEFGTNDRDTVSTQACTKPPIRFGQCGRRFRILNRLFVLILAGVSSYSIASASIVWKLIRARENLDEGTTRGDSDITAIQTRCSNLRQLLGATFFLFGFLFFLGLPNATITVGDGHGLSTFVILNNFVLHFVFAANVFSVFLILHLVRWLTARRVQRCGLRLGN
jgi:hypothetical protein